MRIKFMFGASIALLAAGLIAAPAASAHIQPSYTACSNAFLYDLYLCNDVQGSGLHITSMTASVSSQSDREYDALHIQLYGPAGTIKNCAVFNLDYSDAYTSPVCGWYPNKNERAGDYCARVWQDNGGGNYTSLLTECVGVHS